MNITAFLRDDGACGEYRVNLPLRTWAGNDDSIALNIIQHGHGQDSILKKMSVADVISIPRIQEPEYVHTLKVLQKHGKKIVVDYDDDLFNVSPLSVHYEEYGTEDVTRITPDGEMKLWEDGKSYNKKENLARLDCVKQACESADLVTTTQPVIAEVYKQYNDNVICLPNCIDLNIWNKNQVITPRDTIRIGWSGGSSHFEDLDMIVGALKSIMSLYPQVVFVMNGQQFAGITGQLPQERVECHGWTPTLEHPRKQANLDLDIALIPLVDNKFNQCKSSIKWVEASALETPSVSSYVTPYKEVHDGANGMFVENSTDAWIEGISYLIENESQRIRMGKIARKTVESEFDINTQWHQWKDVYENL